MDTSDKRTAIGIAGGLLSRPYLIGDGLALFAGAAAPVAQRVTRGDSDCRPSPATGAGPVDAEEISRR